MPQTWLGLYPGPKWPLLYTPPGPDDIIVRDTSPLSYVDPERPKYIVLPSKPYQAKSMGDFSPLKTKMADDYSNWPPYGVVKVQMPKQTGISKALGWMKIKIRMIGQILNKNMSAKSRDKYYEAMSTINHGNPFEIYEKGKTITVSKEPVDRYKKWQEHVKGG